MGTGLEIALYVAVAASVASAGYGVYSSQEQAAKAKSAASDQKALQNKQIEEQKKQAELQKQIQEARVNRAARIQAAQSGNIAGAVGGGSIFEAANTSTETSAESSISLIEQQAQLQAEQFELAKSQAALDADMVKSRAEASVNQAWANLFGTLGKSATTVLGGINTPNMSMTSSEWASANTGAGATTAGDLFGGR